MAPAGKRINDESSGKAPESKRRRPATEALELVGGGGGEVGFTFAAVAVRGKNAWQVPEFSTQYTSYGFPS